MGGKSKSSRVTLGPDQTSAVDRFIEAVEQATGARLARTHVIRALVDALAQRAVNPRLIRSEEDLKAVFLGLDPKVMESLLASKQKPEKGDGLDAATLEALKNAIK